MTELTCAFLDRALAIFHNPHFLGKRQPLATIFNLFWWFQFGFILIGIIHLKFYLIPCAKNISVGNKFSQYSMLIQNPVDEQQ